MGDKNPKKPKKKKRLATDPNLNPAPLNSAPEVEQVLSKRQMKKNRGR